MNEYIREVQALKSQYVSHQTELSTEFFCGILEKCSHKSSQVTTTMFAQDSSRELDISNVSHFFIHLRKCQPPKKVLIINNYHLSVRYQRKYL